MKLRSILCGVLALAVTVACKPDDVVETPKLDVDKATVSVGAEAGEATFNVTSNNDWTASVDADWVSINPNNGKASDKAVAVKVTADDNPAEQERTATVTVKAGTLSKTVKVTQAAKATTPEPPGPEGPKFEVTELYILGGATDNGWSLDSMEAFAKDGDVWVWEGNLKPGEHFRFPLQKVSGQWWPCLVPTADGTAVVYAEDEIANDYAVAEDGKYKVTVNPEDGSLKVERTGDREAPKFTVNELYMLGSACDTGWSLDEMQAFTNDGGIFTWTGNLKAGEEFRFPLQKVSGQWWPCLMISADGTSLVYGTSDADKVVYTVAETGNYTITIDARNVDDMKVEIVYNGPATEAPEVSWGLMGCFVDNTWATDVPMTKEGEWIVAKNAQFTELTFKIRGNGSWNDAHNIGYAPGTEKGLVNAKLSVVTAEYSKANLGGDAVDIKLNGPAGTYDVYFSFENMEVYVMEAGYKPGEREPIQVEPQEVTYTVVGTLNNINWNNSAPEGLMAKDGDYYVAKNVPLVTAATLYGGADQIEFKIVETGTWDGYGVAAGTAAAPANTEIAVQPNGENIPVTAAEGAYDVYFDKENGKVWVMEPGLKPGETGNEPTGPEMPEIPADYEATVLWEGSMDMTWSAGMQELAYGGYSWGLCKPGQFVKITITPTDPAAQWILGLMYAGADYGWYKIPSLPDSYFQPENGIVIFEITEEILALLAAPNNGLVLHGENVTAKKVELYAAPGSDESADNMITNGGFENGEAGWMGWSWGPFTQAIEEGRDGGKCIVLTLGECTNLWDAQIVQDIQALTPGTYTYEFYAKSDSGDHQIQVFAQETKTYQGVYGSDGHKAATEWTLYTGEVYYDGTIENINRFGLQFGKAGASGAKIWIDDIKFGLKK